MTRVIKLMTDYGCHPLWESGGAVGNIDPDSLPLSEETRRALAAWAATRDSWLDLDDPAGSPEPPPEAVRAFEAEGVRLWRRLREELGPSFEVHYFHRGKVLRDPAELERG